MVLLVYNGSLFVFGDTSTTTVAVIWIQVFPGVDDLISVAPSQATGQIIVSYFLTAAAVTNSLRSQQMRIE